MSENYTVVVEPPYHDDQWACLWASFDDNEFWHAVSKDAALDRLQERYENPRGVSWMDAEPSSDTIVVDAHPDFEGAITPSEIAGAGLSAFGVSDDGQFGGDGQHWRYSHHAYDEVIRPLHDADGDTVVQIRTEADTNPTPEEWDWERSVWIRTATDGDGFAVWVHDAPDYEWSRHECVDGSTVARICDGDLPTSNGGMETIVRYRTIAVDDDQQSHLEWSGLDDATVIWHESQDGTPFGPSFNFVSHPTTINGWTFCPDSLSMYERWNGPGGNIAVKVRHYGDFSWFEIRDTRLGGVGSSVIPDGAPSKVQSDLSASEARDAAVEWMETHDPELWEHDAYNECLFDVPSGWEMLSEPSVSQGQDPEVSVTYGQEVGDYTRALKLSATVKTGDTDLALEYRRQADSEHREWDHLYRIPTPVRLSDRASVSDAHEEVVKIARLLNEVDVTGAIPKILNGAANNSLRGSGPYGAVTPSKFA